MNIVFEALPICPFCSKKKETQRQVLVKVWNGKEYMLRCGCGWTLEEQARTIEIPNSLSLLVKFLLERCMYQVGADFTTGFPTTVHKKFVHLSYINFGVGSTQFSGGRLEWFTMPESALECQPAATNFALDPLLKVLPDYISQSVQAHIGNGFILTQVTDQANRKEFRLERVTKDQRSTAEPSVEIARATIFWHPER